MILNHGVLPASLALFSIRISRSLHKSLLKSSHLLFLCCHSSDFSVVSRFKLYFTFSTFSTILIPLSKAVILSNSRSSHISGQFISSHLLTNFPCHPHYQTTRKLKMQLHLGEEILDKVYSWLDREVKKAMLLRRLRLTL